LKIGIEEIDKIIEKDRVVGFRFQDRKLMKIMYHRALVESAPVNLILLGERCRILEPYLLLSFSRILGKSLDGIKVKRAFKREDVFPTIESMYGNLIIMNPYVYGNVYDSLMRRREGKTFLFYLNEPVGLRAETSILDIEKIEKRNLFSIIVRKSPSYPNLRMTFPTRILYFRQEQGILKWVNL